MNQDEIIEMARESGLPHWYEDDTLVNESRVIKFAKLIAAKEREACAKLCDSEKKWWDGMSYAEKDIHQAIDNISACVRARGEV